MPEPDLPPPIAVEEIFRVAAALPTGERAAYLDAACEGRPEMRARVERMLEVLGIGAYLQQPTGETVSPEIEAELARLKPEEGGERIGDYKLLQQIGEGGFGVVWMAEQIEPVRRRVALKIIKLGMDTKEVIARFEQERQALAMMDHPNIAKVFDAGATQYGRPFFVMELVRGIRITEYCDQNNLPTAERLQLFVAVCHAVQHAHQKGIIHRDLKPSNILVTLHDSVPVVKVIDFGVAKATQQQRLTDLTFFTQFEQMIGTPLYMSPEQAEMSGLDIDTRSDIYSLGVLLYELLTGQTPFDPKELLQAGHDEMRRVIREEEPQKPSTALKTMAAVAATHVARHRQSDPPKLVQLMRGDLDWIVMKALEKDRTRRYATATAFADDLIRHLGNEPVTAAAPNVGYTVRKFLRRNRVAVSVSAVILFVLVVGITVSTWLAVRATGAEGLAERRLDDVATERDAKEQTSQRLREQLRFMSRSDHAIAGTLLVKGSWREGLAYLGRAIENDPDNAAAKEHLWNALLSGTGDRDRLPRRILDHQGDVNAANFNADGTRLVTASADNTARIWDAMNGQPIGNPLRHDGRVWKAGFSADGRYVVTASMDQTARLWDAATGRQVGEPLRHNASVSSASFSADSTRVVTASADNTARIWDVATGLPIGEPLRHEAAVVSASFSPDGTRVATASTDKTARIWDAVNGQLVGQPLRHEAEVRSASFSPDGTRVVTASRDKTARVWDAVNGQPVGELLHHGGHVFSATFSPDGTRVVTASEDKTARIWDAESGQPAGEPLRHDAEVLSAVFSPDDTRVLTASFDNTARIWDAANGQPIGEPLRHAGPLWSACFNANGTRVATACQDNTAGIWDAGSSQLVGEPFRHAGPVQSANFSADGTRIVTASVDKIAQVWDAVSGQPLGQPMQHGAEVWRASFSADGTRVVTASADKTARVWDAASCQPLTGLLLHEGEVWNASFSADGSRVVTASLDKTARIWDAATGKPVGEPLRHEAKVSNASFSPDGTRVATASFDRTGQIWDAGTGRPIGEPLQHKAEVWNVSFSADGTRVVTAGIDKTAQVWDATTGRPVGVPLRHEASVLSASFSVDGHRVVTASTDKTVRIWEVESSQPIGQPLRHEAAVAKANFSADGARVLTVSVDKTARIWHVASGQALGELRHDAGVGSASFSADGARVLTSSDDNTARIWDAESGQPIDLASLEKLIGAAAGLQFSKSGILQPVTGTERLALRDSLILAKAADVDWSRMLDWLFSPPDRQTARLRGQQSLREVADREMASGQQVPLRNILSYDPGHPLLPLALAAFEVEGQRTEFLRNYSLNHLPADARLWTRAAEMLLAQRQEAFSVRALERLTQLDGPSATRLQARLHSLHDSTLALNTPTAPTKFRCASSFEEPGDREWIRRDDNWSVRSPDGKVKVFHIARRAEVDGQAGTVASFESEHLEVFISDRDTLKPRIYTRVGEAEWSYAGMMRDIQ